MNATGIIIAALVIGVVGLLVGFLLVEAGEKFKVEVDEKEAAVRDLLPGNNCGGCGYAGCDGLAAAIAKGEAAVNACPVGGTPVGEAISAVMGVDAGSIEPMVAFVKCAGTLGKAKEKCTYSGIQDCRMAAMVPGKGSKKCTYGCMGFGSCVKECQFDAISIIDGVAVVNKAKCKACGKCVVVCPNQLIELVPFKAQTFVRCNSPEKGKIVRANCDAGCIGCGACVKVCEQSAITLNNGSLAKIDYSKCTNCGACIEKCPTKVICKIFAKK